MKNQQQDAKLENLLAQLGQNIEKSSTPSKNFHSDLMDRIIASEKVVDIADHENRQFEEHESISDEHLVADRAYHVQIFKPLLIASCAAALILIFIFSQVPTDSVGTALFQSGDVTLTAMNEKGSGLGLDKGSRVQTGKTGEALLSLDSDRVQLYLASQSDLTVRNEIDVSLQSGASWVSVKKDSGDFYVDLNDTRVHVTGTSFGLVNDQKTSYIFLAHGSIELTTPSGETVELTPNHLAVVTDSDVNLVDYKDNEAQLPTWVPQLHQDFQVAYNAAYFRSARSIRLN